LLNFFRFALISLSKFIIIPLNLVSIFWGEDHLDSLIWVGGLHAAQEYDCEGDAQDILHGGLSFLAPVRLEHGSAHRIASGRGRKGSAAWKKRERWWTIDKLVLQYLGGNQCGHIDPYCIWWEQQEAHLVRLALALLGAFAATLDEKPLCGLQSDKVRGLLIYMAVERGRAHRRQALAGLFWPDFPEEGARANLRQARERQLERRSRRVLQALAVVFLLAVLSSGGLAYGVYRQSQEVEKQRQTAVTQQAIAEQQKQKAELQKQEVERTTSTLLTVEALQELKRGDPERSVLLGLEALENYPYTSQAESALAQIAQEVFPYSFLNEKNTITKYYWHSVAWSPDGKRLVSSDTSGQVKV
jgi:hypothetical protein